MCKSIPPCIGNMLPLSLRPMSPLKAEIVTSPMNPALLINKPAAIATIQVIGVSHSASSTASNVVVTMPPRKPSQVLFGLTLGMIFFAPQHFFPAVLCHVVELGQKN